MRKIILISEAFPPLTGGSSRWFWEIYRRLPRSHVWVAAGDCRGHEPFDRTHNLPVSRLPLSLPDVGLCNPRTFRAYWDLARQVRSLAKQEGTEVLHCGRCLPDGWIAWLLKRLHGMPYLCYVHGEEVKLASSGQRGGIMSSRQMRWMARRVFRGAELLIANSQNTQRILIEEWGLPSVRIRVLPPGVDTAYFAPAPRDLSLRARLGWGDRPAVLTVGRLTPRKGHDHMILALRAIREVIPAILYAIVGDGDQRPALQELVAREGLGDHVQFLGELDDGDVLRCYQQCDLFVLPNRQVGQDIEGFGMVLLEAQACGKPVVAGASGGTAETMQIPETGQVVPCDGPDELAALVVELLNDRDRLTRMGEAARKWVVERFDWEALSQQARQIFDRASPPEDENNQRTDVVALTNARSVLASEWTS